MSVAYDFENLTPGMMLKTIVPISRLNKGEAGKIIEEVKKDGFRVIVKNNNPECIMMSVENYNALMDFQLRRMTIMQSPEEVQKRKDFIKKIRENVQPPMEPTITLEEAVKNYGPIDVDEEAVNELRRISII